MRLEMTDKKKLPFCGSPISVATMGEELFMHCSFCDDFINVFNRSNLRKVKHVIQTRYYNFHPRAIVACNLSNCVYVLGQKVKRLNISLVAKITKDDGNQYVVSSWISDLTPNVKYIISVSPEGSLILSRTEGTDEIIRIYKIDGSFQQEIRLNLYLFNVTRIIPKSNGNLVFVSLTQRLDFVAFKTQLTETSLDGNIVRQYHSSLPAADVDYADSEDRLLIVDRDNKLELLDPQFNPVHVNFPKETSDNLWAHPALVHYDRLRNEVLVIEFKFEIGATLSIINFREDKDFSDLVMTRKID